MTAWVEDTGRLRSVRGGKYSWLSVLWKRYKKKGPRCSATCHRGFTEGGQPASSGVQEGLFSSHRAHHHTVMRSLKQAPQRHRTSGNHESHVRWHLSKGCRKCPGDLPQEVLYDKEKGIRLYFHMCLDKEVTLFRLLGNPAKGHRSRLAPSHCTLCHVFLSVVHQLPWSLVASRQNDSSPQIHSTVPTHPTTSKWSLVMRFQGNILVCWVLTGSPTHPSPWTQTDGSPS